MPTDTLMPTDWPRNLSFAAFKKTIPYNQSTIYHAVFGAFANQIQVQREEAAVPNLEKIFKATFRLSNKHSFHAMSLRDLNRETGISMGGLYNYIGSKEELAHMIETFMNNNMVSMGMGFIHGIENARQRIDMIARVYIYMAEIFLPWYQFVYMETKSMTKRQKELAKGMEIRDIQMIQEAIEQGQSENIIDRELHSKMIASTILAVIQNWYLKRWRFEKDGIQPDEYANFVTATVDKLISPWR